MIGPAKKYVVVENAGDDDERDVREFSSFGAAAAWLNHTYDHDDFKRLHPDIVKICTDGSRTYEY